MELTGETVIRAPREHVFDALHDPLVLQQVIPDCRSLTRLAPERFRLAVAARPRSGLDADPDATAALIEGTVQTYNVDRPAGYSLRAVFDAGDGEPLIVDLHVALAAIGEGATNVAYHLTAEPIGRNLEAPGPEWDTAVRDRAAHIAARLERRLGGPPSPLEQAVARAWTGAGAGTWKGGPDWTVADETPAAGPDWTIRAPPAGALPLASAPGALSRAAEGAVADRPTAATPPAPPTPAPGRPPRAHDADGLLGPVDDRPPGLARAIAVVLGAAALAALLLAAD